MSDAFPRDLSRLDRLDGLSDFEGDRNSGASPKDAAKLFPPKRAVDVLREQEQQLYREGRRVFVGSLVAVAAVLVMLGAAIVGAL